MPWRERLVSWLSWHYPSLSPEQLVPTASPGYWEDRIPCHGECRMGHRAPLHHTIYYEDPRRDRATGRWLSPYETWRAARAEEPS